MNFKFISQKKTDTTMLAKKIARVLTKHDVITLTGDLGAGKTTFVSGVIHAFDKNIDVTSPTFVILKCYFDTKIPIFHIDAYRLENGNKEIGLDEYIGGDGITFIEWPNFIKEYLPKEYLEIKIKNLGGNKREFTIVSPNIDYTRRLKKAL